MFCDFISLHRPFLCIACLDVAVDVILEIVQWYEKLKETGTVGGTSRV